MATTPSVYGVREALATLRSIDPKLKAEAVKSIREAAGPLADAVRSRLPNGPPLSGMSHHGRTGWLASPPRVRAKVGGRKGKSAEEWPLVSVILSGTAAAIFDIAGRGSGGSSSSGRALVAGLSGRHGSASRAAWPGAEATMQRVQADVTRAVDAVMRQANADLNVVTKTPGA